MSILKHIGLGRCVVGNVEQIPQLRFLEFTGEWQEKRLGNMTVNKPSTITAGQLSDSFEGYAVQSM